MTRKAFRVRSVFEAGEKEVLLLQGASAVIVGVACLWQGLWPPPGLLAIGILLGILIRFQSHALWSNLVPFLIVGLTYQSLGRLSHNLSPEDIHITDLIAWERALFGGSIPAAVFQALLFEKDYTFLLDVFANVLYFSHFILPVVVGLLIWYRKRNAFWAYLLGFCGMSYLGFLTYVIYPAAPPWWAYQKGYLPEAVSLDHFLLSNEMMISTPNPVAAMPSMHCAYPLYVALAASVLWGRRGLWLWVIPVGVGLSVIYLGHHYVVDILVGYLYGLGGAGLLSLRKDSRADGVISVDGARGST